MGRDVNGLEEGLFTQNRDSVTLNKKVPPGTCGNRSAAVKAF